MTPTRRKINERRQKVGFLISRSFTTYEIADQLGISQSTVSRDVQVLKTEAQQFVYDLAKGDLAYYYQRSLEGIEQTKRESWKIYNDETVSAKEKLLALRLIFDSDVMRFRLLSEGPSVLAVKSLEDRLNKIENGNSRQVNR